MEIHRSIGRRRAAGFTLLELLVVLVLISLVSALALPRIAGSVPSLQLKTSARKVISILRFARGRTVTEQVPFGVRFDPAQRTVQVVTAVDPEREDQTVPPSNSLEAFVLPEDVGLCNLAGGETAPVIGFYPTGASTGGEIILTTEGDRQMRVRVAALTGNIEIVNQDE